MEKLDGKYIISKNVLSVSQNLAYYIEVEDERNGISSYSSSLVYIVK